MKWSCAGAYEVKTGARGVLYESYEEGAATAKDRSLTGEAMYTGPVLLVRVE